MKDIKKSFVFDTPLVAQYGALKGQVVAYARISGEAEKPYYMDEEIDADLINFNVTNVRLKIGSGEQDVTFAYMAAKGMLSDFSGTINDAVTAHMGYLFSEQYEKYEGDHTDTVQGETDSKQYGVTMIVEAPSEKAA